MSATALYPGTFDPVTNGHTDLIRRATRIFDRLIVAVAANPAKRPMFSLDERVGLVRDVLADVSNLEIVGFDNLLVEFVQQSGAQVVLRGLRAVSDFEYEFQMAAMNRRLAPEVETVFMTPSEEVTFISASLVKEIAMLGGNVTDFVDTRVAAAMAAKIGR